MSMAKPRPAELHRPPWVSSLNISVLRSTSAHPGRRARSISIPGSALANSTAACSRAWPVFPVRCSSSTKPTVVNWPICKRSNNGSKRGIPAGADASLRASLTSSPYPAAVNCSVRLRTSVWAPRKARRVPSGAAFESHRGMSANCRPLGTDPKNGMSNAAGSSSFVRPLSKLNAIYWLPPTGPSMAPPRNCDAALPIAGPCSMRPRICALAGAVTG